MLFRYSKQNDFYGCNECFERTKEIEYQQIPIRSFVCYVEQRNYVSFGSRLVTKAKHINRSITDWSLQQLKEQSTTSRLHYAQERSLFFVQSVVSVCTCIRCIVVRPDLRIRIV